MKKIQMFSTDGIKKFKYVCSRFLSCVFGLISLSSWFFLWCLICGIVQVLFLRLIVNFEFFSSHFSLTTLGLDLFSGAYFNSFTVCILPSDKTARWCQLTPLMLRSLVCLHTMISWCRPRFGPAWSGFEWWGLVAHGLVQRFMHEFKMNSHVSALNIRGKTSSCILVNTVITITVSCLQSRQCDKMKDSFWLLLISDLNTVDSTAYHT